MERITHSNRDPGVSHVYDDLLYSHLSSSLRRSRSIYSFVPNDCNQFKKKKTSSVYFLFYFFYRGSELENGLFIVTFLGLLVLCVSSLTLTLFSWNEKSCIILKLFSISTVKLSHFADLSAA